MEKKEAETPEGHSQPQKKFLGPTSDLNTKGTIPGNTAGLNNVMNWRVETPL